MSRPTYIFRLGGLAAGELAALEQKLQMHDDGREVHQPLLDLDQLHREMNAPTYFGPVRDWRDVEEPDQLEKCMEELSNFVKEVPFPTGQEARNHLATVTWVEYFFKEVPNDMPLCNAILNRYIRVAELLYYNINNKELMKGVGLLLHRAGGTEMQRAIFYTFFHLFPKLRNAEGDDIGWVRYAAKIQIEKGWDRVGDWRY